MFSLCKQSPWLPFSSPRHCNHIRYSYPPLLGSWHKEMPGSPFKGDVWCGLSDLCVIHWLSSKSISCFFIPFPWFPHPYCLLHVRTCWWQFPCILYWQEADPGHLISCEKKFVRVLTLLEVQNSLSIDPHNPSPSSSSPCLLSAPSSSVRWHVLYMLMETRCGLLWWRRQWVREREKLSMSLYASSLARCRRCGRLRKNKELRLFCCFTLVI